MLLHSGGIAQLGERLHGMQEVSGSIPLTSTKKFEVSEVPKSPSSRGLGHRPFTAITGVRIPVGTPYTGLAQQAQTEFGSAGWRTDGCGVVVQLVRIPACHAGGRGFESRPLRQNKSPCSVDEQGLFDFRALCKPQGRCSRSTPEAPASSKMSAPRRANRPLVTTPTI